MMLCLLASSFGMVHRLRLTVYTMQLRGINDDGRVYHSELFEGLGQAVYQPVADLYACAQRIFAD